MPNRDQVTTDRIVARAYTTDSSYWTGHSSFRLDRNHPYLRLQFVTIFVQNQDRSLVFFVDQLGFSVVADVRFESGNRHLEVAPPDGTAALALVAPEAGSEDHKYIGHSGLVTFLTEDVDAKFREWSDRGVHFLHPPQTPGWGGSFTHFEDLDGNPFALVGFDEVSREIESRRDLTEQRLQAERRVARRWRSQNRFKRAYSRRGSQL